jgi:1-acyl-sn-glycerol-3-phosphate acyltransferase
MKSIIKFITKPFHILHSLVAVSIITVVTIILFPFLMIAVSIDVKKAYAIQWLWAKIILLVTGTRLNIDYQSQIPDSGAIILFNHASFLDIPVLVLVTGRFMYYVAKKELESLPILGFCFKKVKTLMMPRNDLQASIQIYDEAKTRLANGDHFVIAPEGTRNRSDGISDFKSGPFIFAMSAQADLVPVVIKGTRALWPAQDLLPNFRKMTSSVDVVVSEKISTHDWTEANRKAKMLELKNKFNELYH